MNRSTGAPVLLRGVNRSGMEYSEPDEDGFASAAGISRSEIAFLAQAWKCNIVRIPFNQDWALRGRNGHAAESYLRDLDRIVRWASGAGAYTLLDLQWLDADRPFGGVRNFVAPLPNADSIALWTALAARYRDEPAVLYDIFNEPHDPLADDPRPLPREDGTFYPPTQRTVSMAEWQPWARKLTGAVRGQNPDALLFVAGVNWAYDLRGMPIGGAANVVYSTHVYRDKGTDWDGAFGSLAAAVPVFAGEWGGGDADADWARELADYFDSLAMGWTAWSWSDNPFLVTRYTPTAFGAVVRERLGA